MEHQQGIYALGVRGAEDIVVCFGGKEWCDSCRCSVTYGARMMKAGVSDEDFLNISISYSASLVLKHIFSLYRHIPTSPF
jgi:hypothetical protein